MSDLLLAKPKLPDGWIDTSVGEPYLVRDNLIEIFQLKEELSMGHLKLDNLIYPAPNGYDRLVHLLEKKHGAPVIITNGAKQALGACFYALKRLGKDYCAMKNPYWALIPPLAKMHGIEPIFADDTNPGRWGTPYLLLSPNNPDGHCESPQELQELSKQYKDKQLPLIHDAAYYTHIYLPETHTLPPIGDVQIFSISKMLGLSGLRIGYVVCHNPEYYKLILAYMEAMTVGVSIASQTWLFDLLDRRMRSFPTLVQKFEGLSSLQLEANKKICLQINPDVLEVPVDLPSKYGMFGWFKKGIKFDQEKARVNFIDGSLFGGEGMVRMNLALNEESMKEVVNRLNGI